MKHIFLNLKRFDISPEHGGVNRLAPMKDWGRVIVERTQDALGAYPEAEFVMYMPEAHLLGAAAARKPGSAVRTSMAVFSPCRSASTAAASFAIPAASRVTVVSVVLTVPDSSASSPGAVRMLAAWSRAAGSAPVVIMAVGPSAPPMMLTPELSGSAWALLPSRAS